MSTTIGYENEFAPTVASMGIQATTNGVSTTEFDIYTGLDVGGIGGAGLHSFHIKLADVHMIFGRTGVTAATTSHMYYPAGSRVRYQITDATRYVRIIATSAVAGQSVTIARSGP